MWIEYQITDGQVYLEIGSEHKEEGNSKMEILTQTKVNPMIS